MNAHSTPSLRSVSQGRLCSTPWPDTPTQKIALANSQSNPDQGIDAHGPVSVKYGVEAPTAESFFQSLRHVSLDRAHVLQMSGCVQHAGEKDASSARP